MGTLEKDFDCAVEEFIISLEKSGKVEDLLNKETLTEEEVRAKRYINSNNMQYTATDPIKDGKFTMDRGNFMTLIPGMKSPLSVKFNMFETLVTDHLTAGYNKMKISFKELNASETSKIMEIVQEESEAIATRAGHLYAVLSFTADTSADLENATYIVFNVQQPYHITGADLKAYCGDFLASALALRFKSASVTNYVPCSQNYDLRKVKNYTDRIKKYLEECKKKTVEYIDFELCFGERKRDVAGRVQTEQCFYLASIPRDSTGTQLTAHFPYYDQGSLEP
ncbi:hypothetical protein [Chryseobacterium kwangjuense]|uniref:Uncharacterized protein n=1 Tax=Chryseobacterium kwangjuense TaxID=267125 RepID=A0A135WD51_9FLAO|nr:hypothetical protein [Chryseobacterium kwangjuense]KXH82854.1 hypothetical protein AU378_10435 [Chryseobacterium kwangjuense]